MDVLIVHTSSGRGLKKDALILEQALNQLGHKTTTHVVKPATAAQHRRAYLHYKVVSRFMPNPLQQAYFQAVKWALPRPALITCPDLVIHLENIQPSYLRIKGCAHWLIPNQEWFIESRTPYLTFIDLVACKTQHAQSVFCRLTKKTTLLGFTGLSTDTAGVSAQHNHSALHIAGNSAFKGTKAVIDCWLEHPEWPMLTVVSQRAEFLPYSTAGNVRFLSEVSDAELEVLWSSSLYAVCPSEVEGYGQVLAEAMSHGCVPITTDAPPMNELVTPERGFLVPADHEQPFRLGVRYFVTAQALKTCMASVLELDSTSIEHRRAEALKWYSDNDQSFVQRLNELLNAVSQQLPAQSVPTTQETSG